MKKIKETEKLIILQERKSGYVNTYRQHKDDESDTPILICKFKNNTFNYAFEGDSIKEIRFIGYSDLPPFVSPFGFGFNEKSVNNFFRYKFDSSEFNTIVFSKTKGNTPPNSLLLNETDFQELLKSINQEQRACNNTKTILISNFLIEQNAAINFDFKETNNNKELILRNLNSKLLEKLTADDIDLIGKFYVDAAQKYSRPDIVKKMVIGMQKNAQLLTLQEIIKKYEKLLVENPSESTWQTFFDEYITLFDNRYVRKLDYKNIATGITKYPDLVLVDIYGYIDFYELKKCGMQLLAYDASHKTFYWSKDVAMVISQVSDYLQKSKENGLSYAKTIKTETETGTSEGLDVNVINPRAIIVAGSKKELNTAKKRDHFKNLRESLKDIEFILYDELLDRLKNLLSSIKV